MRISRIYVAALIFSSLCAGQAVTDFKLSPRTNKTFSLTLKYTYRAQDYVPPVPVEQAGSDPDAALSPERTLANLYRSAKAGDYPGWLKEWDEPSRQSIEAQRASANLSQSEILRRELDSYRDSRLVAFYFRASYVILRFCRPASCSAIALRQTKDGWPATKAIETEVAALGDSSTGVKRE